MYGNTTRICEQGAPQIDLCNSPSATVAHSAQLSLPSGALIDFAGSTAHASCSTIAGATTATSSSIVGASFPSAPVGWNAAAATSFGVAADAVNYTMLFYIEFINYRYITLDL